MAKIINAYTDPNNSLTSALSGLATGIFGNNQAQQELLRQKALGSIRENENIPLLADAIVNGDYRAAARAGIMAGQDPKFTGGYHQFQQVNQYGPASPQATTATMSVPGANYGHTVAGEREAQANRRSIENLRTERQYQAAINTAENTPTNVIVDGRPTVVSRREAITNRMAPVLDFGSQRGVLLGNITPSLSPEDQRRAVGIDKNPGTLWVYRTPDGRQGTTANGTHDVNDNSVLPSGTQVMKLEGANAEGLTGNAALDRQVLADKNAKDIAVSSITRLQTALSQPNADQAVGYLGSVARGYTDLRSQVEAATRFFSGDTAAQQFSTPEARTAVDSAVNNLFASNPLLNQRAQQLGINSAVIRSQIQDLAYLTAKAQDPGGRVSNEDIHRAAQTIGATIMDPKSAIQVLEDLKGRIETNHDIRMKNLRTMYPRTNSGGAPAAGAPNSAPPQRIRIDTNGNVIQ